VDMPSERPSPSRARSSVNIMSPNPAARPAAATPAPWTTVGSMSIICRGVRRVVVGVGVVCWRDLLVGGRKEKAEAVVMVRRDMTNLRSVREVMVLYCIVYYSRQS